eukprot:COSAG02_NODE_23730_length_710_cov_0.759411_1_plen_221_part_01
MLDAGTNSSRLPKAGPLQHDGIMVVVDQFSKHITAIPVHEAAPAEAAAEAFYREIVCRRGTPLQITHDQDSRFQMKGFWRRLWVLHRTSLKYTTTYTPQQDGQTERANHLLEEILRTNVQPDQMNWLELLDGVVVAINAAPTSTTGSSPFEVETGTTFNHPIDTQILADQTYQNRGVGGLARAQMSYDDEGVLLDAAPYPALYEYGMQEQHRFEHPERMRA